MVTDNTPTIPTLADLEALKAQHRLVGDPRDRVTVPCITSLPLMTDWDAEARDAIGDALHALHQSLPLIALQCLERAKAAVKELIYD